MHYSCDFYRPIKGSVWESREPTDDEKRIANYLIKYNIKLDNYFLNNDSLFLY